MRKITRGLFLGKFQPLHAGHQLVIEFARQMVDVLYVMVCRDPDEIIPWHDRYDWMEEYLGGYNNVEIVTNRFFVHAKKEDTPELFWSSWVGNCNDIGQFDYVFGGEEYCRELADRLGAQFLPVWRNGLEDISATKFLSNPDKYWSKLATVCRPYFIKRISFIGVESAGKSTMIGYMMNAFNTTYVDEWARQYHSGTFRYEDMLMVGKGQVALEEARTLSSESPVILCDTDPLMTYVASMAFFGKADPHLRHLALTHTPYSGTLVFNGEVPYVPDKQREADKLIGSTIYPDGRILKVEDFYEALDGDFKRPYTKITGNSFFYRQTHASAAIAKYLGGMRE